MTPNSDAAKELEAAHARLAELEAAVAEQQHVAEELEGRSREATLLNTVISATTSTLDEAAVLATVCREMGRAFGLGHVTAGLLDDERTALTIVAEHLTANRPTAVGLKFPLADSPAHQYLLEHKQPLVALDAQNDPRLGIEAEKARERGTVSVIYLPLLVDGDVVGRIGVVSSEALDFGEHEVQLGANIAAAVGQALHNAQLYRESQRHRQELEQMVAERTAELVQANQKLEKALNDVEDQYRQMERANEFFRATVDHMNETVRRGAFQEELLTYLTHVRTEFDQTR